MDPVNRVRSYLLDNIGHLTYPGNASFDAVKQRWLVPICCRTDRGSIAVRDAEVDPQGHIVYVPSREEMLARLTAIAGESKKPVS